MFDVDSKDLTVGMSCPPPAFVEKPFLQKVKTILKPEGRRGDAAGPSSRRVLAPGVSVGVVTAGSSVEPVAFSAAGSGGLRHPGGGAAKKGCRKAEGVGGTWEQIVWPPTTRLAAGTWSWAKGTGGMLVLLVLLWGRCFHPGGTDSAAFPREGRRQGDVHRLLGTAIPLTLLQESSCSTWCAATPG